LAEIGDEQLYLAAGLGAQTLGKRSKPLGIAGYEDEVMPATGEAICIDGANASGGAGDDGSAKG
jgi:hypothetical protein